MTTMSSSSYYRVRSLYNNSLTGTIPDSLKITSETELYVQCTTLYSQQQ